MESMITLYLMIYLVITGIALLFLLSPLALYLSFRLFRIFGKNTLLISLVLAIPCLGILSLPEIFGWNPWAGYLVTGFLSLIYFTFLFRKMFKGSLSKSIGLSLSYGLMNILLIAACLFLLSLISRDQPLDPDAREWLSAKPPVVADADNLYFALIGFSADPNVNPHQAGLQCMREYNEYIQKKATAQKQVQPVPPLPACFSPKSSSFDDDLDNLCEVTEPDCLTRFRTEQSQFDALFRKYQFLINNYKDLSLYTGYSNVGPRESEVPSIHFASLVAIHRLFVAQTIFDYLKGNRSESLETLQKDIWFQRQNLIRSNNHIFLMVSVSLLNRDLYLYSELLDQDVMEKSFQKELEISLPSDKEKDLKNVLQGEFQFANHALQSEFGISLDKASQLQKFPQQIFFKPNATLNRLFRNYKGALEWSRIPAHKRSSAPNVKAMPSPDFWDVGYNPVGNIIFSIASPNLGTYAYRLDDLDGLIRLVKIKQRIRHDRIAKDQIESFLKQDLPYCRGPYTNRPMTWDGTTETLYFMDPSKEGQRIAIDIPFSVK